MATSPPSAMADLFEGFPSFGFELSLESLPPSIHTNSNTARSSENSHSPHLYSAPTAFVSSAVTEPRSSQLTQHNFFSGNDVDLVHYSAKPDVPDPRGREGFGTCQPLNATLEQHSVNSDDPTLATPSETANDTPTSAQNRLKCPIQWCGRSYSKKGQLNRHLKTHFGRRFLCPEDLCPKGILNTPDPGFPRRDKLVDHLISKHKIERKRSNYIAGHQ